jgi:hypothetical protein
MGAGEPATRKHKRACDLFQIFSRQLLQESTKTRGKEITKGKEEKKKK